MRSVLARAVQYVLQNRRGMWCAVLAAGVLFGIFEFAVTRWCTGVKLAPNLHAALQAFIVGLGAGVALWFLLLGIIERRRILADELARLAELNHSVRNSLELILLANYSNADRERKTLILECTSQIDKKLRELFPSVGKSRIVIKKHRTGAESSEGGSPGRTQAPDV